MEAWIDGRIVAVPYVEESLTLRSYFVDAARGVLPERRWKTQEFTKNAFSKL